MKNIQLNLTNKGLMFGFTYENLYEINVDSRIKDYIEADLQRHHLCGDYSQPTIVKLLQYEVNERE